MNRRRTGARYETMAEGFLREQGFLILEKNFRCRMGEIDIIAREREYIVFVEVKYRKSIEAGYPEEAVGYRKQSTIKTVASYYLMKKNYPADTPVRFDVVAIEGTKLRHHRNAF